MATRVNKKSTPVRSKAAGRSGASHPKGLPPNDEGLQARLLEAQAAMERDYARLREFESRYRQLFVATTDALLVVEARSLRVLDANPAACGLLEMNSQKLVGASVLAALHAKVRVPLEAMAAQMIHGGQPGRLRVEAAVGGRHLQLVASLSRQDGAFTLLFRLDTAGSRSSGSIRPDAIDDWAHYSVSAPDAIVLTDLSGKVLHANPAFVELVQVATERQVKGEQLGRWVGRTSVDLGVLITNLRQRSSLKLFTTKLRSEHGTVTEVEISAALVSAAQPPCLGFTLRDVGRRLVGDTHARDDLSKSVGQLAELVGRVPMREIVANTGGLIEQMCIEAALQLTRDNRAAAAELLGLSRQSLYVKLRRYGLATPDEAPEANA